MVVFSDISNFSVILTVVIVVVVVVLVVVVKVLAVVASFSLLVALKEYHQLSLQGTARMKEQKNKERESEREK